MIDHLGIPVKNYSESKAFYLSALAPLGIGVVMEVTDAEEGPALGRALLTSSFTGWNNYMHDLGEVVNDPEAMKHFGGTMVMWDLKAMKPLKIFNVPGAPLEIRWSLNDGENWAITAAALTSKLWLIKQDASGAWQAKEVGTIGDPAKIPLPVDISITRRTGSMRRSSSPTAPTPPPLRPGRSQPRGSSSCSYPVGAKTRFHSARRPITSLDIFP